MINICNMAAYPRNVLLVMEDILKIIPEEEETRKYRNRLSHALDSVRRNFIYVAPDVPYGWAEAKRVLDYYNTDFIEKGCDWALAIMHIFNGNYDAEVVAPYKDGLKHITRYSNIRGS